MVPVNGPPSILLGPRRPFPRDRSVLDLFAACVERAPERPAVLHRDRSLSYAELDRRSDAVAAELLRRGVRHRQLVPMLIDGGVELPIAMFGIMKANAAFAPLDRGWPPERLRETLRRLDSAVVVTRTAEAVSAEAAGLSASESLVVDAVPPAADRFEPTGRPRPEDLIYGFHTSGSTGVPKCALNLHRGLVNRLTAMSHRFGDGADHITLQNSRSTFDSSIWQLLWPLTSGGRVVLPHREGILDLEGTIEEIGRHGVTAIDFVPSILTVLVSVLESRPSLLTRLSTLRRVLVGGEAINPVVVHRLREMLPAMQVTNTYGPTECSIGSVFHEVRPQDGDAIPLGRPIDNTHAAVLDETGRPVPRGTVGEIHLGGECLGAGYLDDPSRTREAFVPNPLAEIPGDRLYRTGDLGWVDEARHLRFVGRDDDQVQLGGVRIELGEVETALASHPAVGDVKAVVRGEGEARSLIACVTARADGRRPVPEELREHAAGRLPDEAVPGQILVLESLPLNHNGKSDRTALSEMVAVELAAVKARSRHVPPATPEEELVAKLWCEQLGLDQVSVTVPFRDVGGTSLTAFALSVRLAAESKRPVQPGALLDVGTVREQAKLIAAARGGAAAGAEADERSVLAEDLRWDDELGPGGRDPRRRCVLVTGATGFIGSHLVADLLSRDFDVVCLVRSASDLEAIGRLRRVLAAYRVAPDAPIGAFGGSQRMQAISGDLGEPRLGLSERRFASLARQVDCVVHAAGMVSFITGYTAHRDVNVGGLRELVRLAATAGGVPLHVLSTLSVFSAWDPGVVVGETELPSLSALPEDGYSRSKLVAELLLETARGVPVQVYRLGEVWPHRDTGIANPSSAVHNLLYAWARTGCAFGTDAVVDVTPVDVIGRFIATCVSEQAPPERPYHVLARPSLPLSLAIEAVHRRTPLSEVSYREFHHRLTRLATAEGADERLIGLAMVLPRPEDGDAVPERFGSLFADAADRFDSGRFHRRAERMGLPHSDQAPLEVLDRCFDHLSRAAAEAAR